MWKWSQCAVPGMFQLKSAATFICLCDPSLSFRDPLLANMHCNARPFINPSSNWQPQSILWLISCRAAHCLGCNLHWNKLCDRVPIDRSVKVDFLRVNLHSNLKSPLRACTSTHPHLGPSPSGGVSMSWPLTAFGAHLFRLLIQNDRTRLQSSDAPAAVCESRSNKLTST